MQSQPKDGTGKEAVLRSPEDGRGPLGIEYLALSDLTGYPNNARLHSKTQIEQIVKSVQNVGWTNPILVDENNQIIAGHGRLEAAKVLEMEMVPCIRLPGLTESQKRALVISDNKIALNSTWDVEMLKQEIEVLRLDGFDIALTGFDNSELDLFEGTAVHDPLAEWDGMPAFEHEDQKGCFSVVMHFKDEASITAFAELIGQKIEFRDKVKRTKALWYPEEARVSMMDKRYLSE